MIVPKLLGRLNLFFKLKTIAVFAGVSCIQSFAVQSNLHTKNSLVDDFNAKDNIYQSTGFSKEPKQDLTVQSDRSFDQLSPSNLTKVVLIGIVLAFLSIINFLSSLAPKGRRRVDLGLTGPKDPELGIRPMSKLDQMMGPAFDAPSIVKLDGRMAHEHRSDQKIKGINILKLLEEENISPPKGTWCLAALPRTSTDTLQQTFSEIPLNKAMSLLSLIPKASREEVLNRLSIGNLLRRRLSPKKLTNQRKEIGVGQ